MLQQRDVVGQRNFVESGVYPSLFGPISQGPECRDDLLLQKVSVKGPYLIRRVDTTPVSRWTKHYAAAKAWRVHG